MDRRDRMEMNGGNKIPTVSIFDENDCETEIPLPTIKEVCPTCRGNGVHVNPSIDSHGLSAEDFASDPDFSQDYFSGTYNQTCNECHGLRVIDVVDVDSCDPKLYGLYEEQTQADHEFQSMCDYERRMGC